MDDQLTEQLKIRALIERWAITRDAGDWAAFADVWHPQGVMMATWFQGSAEEFIRVSREGFERGVKILHFLGGTAVSVQGTRATAQTKMTITQRATVHGVDCDVICTGRFFDFLTCDTGKWTVRLRQPIYEQDRIHLLDPSATLALDQQTLARFPEGYRHLAYVQEQIGYTVKRDMPGLTGERVQQLYAAGRGWLEGGELSWP